MARFLALFAVFAVVFVATDAYINCCNDPNGCSNACQQQNCGFAFCCSNGCTVSGQQIPACACACGGCPSKALAASGFLGNKVADAVLCHESGIKTLNHS